MKSAGRRRSWLSGPFSPAWGQTSSAVLQRVVAVLGPAAVHHADLRLARTAGLVELLDDVLVGLDRDQPVAVLAGELARPRPPAATYSSIGSSGSV